MKGIRPAALALAACLGHPPITGISAAAATGTQAATSTGAQPAAPTAPADAVAKGPDRRAPPPADSSWVRVGVIVASRRGLPEDKPLRYAYQDGEKLERLMATVGQVAPENLFYLKAERRDDLQQAAARAGRRIAALKQEGRKVFLQFYYTGHGAARNFHFSDGPLGFDVVKEALGGLSADARVYVLDVCYGASFFTAKGFRTAPPVQLQMEMDRAAKGEVTISSSSGDEQAYEVRTLGGSIFTSHWIMALRGAGDRNRDGQVTLFEAYNYSYDRTAGYSAETLARPQHPAFQIDLTGARDVMLARLLHSSTGLLFRNCPAGNYNVLDLSRGHPIGELRVPEGEEFTLALEQGRYRVQYLPARGQALSADVDLPAAGMTPLPFSAFAPASAAPGQGKGPGGFPLADVPDSLAAPWDWPPLPRTSRTDFPGEIRWRLSGQYGVGWFRDDKLAGNFEGPSELDGYFGLGGAFAAPDLRRGFTFDLAYSPYGLWVAGLRLGISSATWLREASGSEPILSVPDSLRETYPVRLRYEAGITDVSLVPYAGRSFRLGRGQALSVDLGGGRVGREISFTHTLERSLYGSRTRSSRTAQSGGWRLEGSLGYWLFPGAAGHYPAVFGVGLRLSPWYQVTREENPDAGRPSLDSREAGISLGLVASLGRRRPLTAGAEP